MSLRSTTTRLLLGALAGACSTVALAQWQWLDRDGRKVFSDRAPPAEITEDRILVRPRSTRPTTAPTAPAATPTTPPVASPDGSPATPPPVAGAVPKPTGEDKELIERKKQAEAAEANKKKAEDARIAKARKDNCERARGAKATLDSGIRIAQTNAQGERSFLDDATRAAETKRAQDVIASDCK